MKAIIQFCTIILWLGISSLAIAFNSETDCSIKITKSNFQGWNISSIQNILDDYTNSNYSTYKDGQYILCFNEPLSGFVPKTTLNIDTSKIQKAVLIYNFVASAEKLTTPILLQLSGSNITLDHATLAGPGTCTALKIDAKGVTIDTANISKFATAIETGANSENVSVKNSSMEIPASAGMTEGAGIAGVLLAGKGHSINTATLTGSGTGTAIQINSTGATIADNTFNNLANPISIADGADANILGNSFLDVSPEKIITFTAQSQKYLDIAWIGKHIRETDVNLTDRIAGKVFIGETEECAGTVELLVRKKINNNSVSYKIIDVSPLAGDKAIGLKVKDDPADKPSKTINIGDCYFDIADINLSLEETAGFTFTNANKQTVQFLPPQALITDLPEVISLVSMPPISVPTTTLGADGVTIYIPGIETGASGAGQKDAADPADEVDLGPLAEVDEVDTIKEGSSLDPSVLPPSDELADDGAKPITVKDKEDDGGDSPSQGVTGFATLSQGCSLNGTAASDARQTLAFIITFLCAPVILIKRRYDH